MVTPTPLATQIFRTLVDQAYVSLTLDSEADVISAFGSRLGGVQPAVRWEIFQKAMQEAICTDKMGESALTILQRLWRSVVYEAALGETREPYATVLRALRDSCRVGAPRPLEQTQSWIDAIQAARALLVLVGDVPEMNPREDAVSAAARRMAARGAALRVEDGRFVIEEAEFARLAAALDRRGAALGGYHLLRKVMQHLTSTEPLVFGRYAPGRRFGFDRTEPSLPIGYLLQLGAKHLNARPAIDALVEHVWKNVAQDATDLCAVLDVEPYSNLEGIVLNPFETPQYLGRIAVFDHMFALRQWPPTRAKALLRGVIANLDSAEVQKRMGWSLLEVVALLDAVLDLGRQPWSILTGEQLADAGVSPAAWQKLRPHFVHAPGQMNRTYVSPLDADKAEFDFKPLLGLANGALLVVSPGLAALGFYEATTRALRDAGYPDLDTILGDAVEAVAAAALRSAGLNVTVAGTEYSLPGAKQGQVSGECDIVVETANLIVFVELKKKPLRRVSSTGDAAAGLVDLSTSLFAAQSQLAQHELALLQHGEIRFTNGYKLTLGARKIERIAMTWLDYGGLQDRMLISQIFDAFVGKRLTTEHPKEGAKLKKLNAAISKVETELEASQKFGKQRGAAFKNLWFLSVPQLHLLLDGVTGPEEFEKRMSTMGVLTYRTLDFYRDFGVARQGGLV